MNPNRIIVHCAATPEGGWYSVADIDRWHKARGWRGIGYHKVVLLDGTVEDGRPEDQQGAHVAGHNQDTLAICYIGGMDEHNRRPKDTRTAAQYAAIESVVHGWIRKYKIPVDNVLGHYELDDRKACPSFDMEKFRAELRREAFKDEDDEPDLLIGYESLPRIGGPTARPAIVSLQRLLGVEDDGWIGPITYQAIADLDRKP